MESCTARWVFRTWTRGLLVEGFEELSTLITLYNYPNYMEHLERLGYTKDIDWWISVYRSAGANEN
jgi:hypothetical protein